MQFVRKSAIFVFSALMAVSAFGQDRTVWRTTADINEGVRGDAIGTVTDINEGRNRFTLVLDDDRYGIVTVETDAVSTQYKGFGGTINGSPEIFVGSSGFTNLRVGDRVDAHGTGRGNAAVVADTITLLGRNVPAAQTGIGQTRPPGSISSPTTRGSTPTTAPESVGRIEGIVRQVNLDEGRIVIETGARQMITIRAVSTTPVYYRGDVYRISNLEVGDRIRIDPESGSTSGGEIRARTVEVTQSVQDTQPGSPRQVGALSGRVTRVDRTANVVRVDTGREEVRVDLSAAADTMGRRVRATDIQVGDRLDLSGSYSGDVFVASTVRFADDVFQNRGAAAGGTPSTATVTVTDLGAVTIYGTVTQTLSASPQLVVRDTQNNRTYRIFILEDFVVRTRTGAYTTADKLKEGDPLVIKAYRDSDGNYIAQTIRQR